MAEVFKGIIRAHGAAAAKKEAAITEVVRDAAREAGKAPGLRGRRDRALLLLGFAAAMRRSKLVGLDAADLAFTPDGAVLTLRRGKTDQEGQGTQLGILFGDSPLTFPARAVQGWIAAAGLERGPLFRGVKEGARLKNDRLRDPAVALIVKGAVEAAGYDPALYSGHSLRSGFATNAARAGVPEAHIQNQTRHKSLPVLRGYIRRGSLLRDNAASRVGS